MQKRNTVPFYNRRRSLEQRETLIAKSDTVRRSQPTSPSWFNRLNKWTYNTTASCAPTTVTSTVTVKAVCSSTGTPPSASNTTYIGPALPCFPTSTATPIISSSPSKPDRTCSEDQKVDPVFQRPNGQVFVRPAPALASAPAPSSIQDALPVFQRPNGQPFDMPVPSPSSIVKRQAADWSRVAYYTSTAPAQATGLSFMANLGDPQKSGTFD